MEPILYRGNGGGQINMDQQSITANNLANVNTPGFKADMLKMKSAIYQTDSGVQNEYHYSVSDGSYVNLKPGPIMTTGRDLDVAVSEQGWIAVQDANGQEAYTRNGSFKIDSNGQLMTNSGRPVLGDGGPISIPPSQRIDIGDDGTISVVPLDAGPNELAVLDRIRLVKIEPNAQVEKNKEGLVRLANGAKPDTDPTIKVTKGSLEGSNVDAFTEMVRMIESGREFESSMKLMQTVEDKDRRLAQLLHE